MNARERYMTNTQKLATEAFEAHRVELVSPGRWLVHRSGDSAYWTEVIALHGAGLLVDGDIDHVIFRYGPAHPPARVRWMAKTKGAADGYFCEKATIGSGREVVRSWRPEVARYDLAELQEEARESCEDAKRLDRLIDGIDDIKRCLDEMDEASVYRELYELSFYDELPRVGTVPAPRLFYVHAALVKLASWLDEADAKGNSPCTETSTIA